MSARERIPSEFQRNALAPALIAAVTLVVAPVLIDGPWRLLVLFVVSILALIVAWFAVQARQWWWVPVFVAVATIWNPVIPFPFSGPVWVAAQLVAAVVFLIAGALIKVRRA